MVRSPPARRPIRRELLFSTTFLFTGAILVAVGAVVVALPLLGSPLYIVLFVGVLVVADVGLFLLFLRALLGRTVFDPLERIGLHAEKIAGGAYGHRIPAEGGEEVDRLVRSLNTMAERLISDKDKLAENIRSLDETNQELMETTEELVQAARMASVGTLAAGVAHEVGNPLGALMGNLDVARQRIRTGRDGSDPLSAAMDEARRIDRIVRSILEFARPKTAEDRSLVEISETVERTVDLLKGRGVLEKVTVEVALDPDLPGVRARPQHLEQALMNILMNGIRAMDGRPDPRIRIRARTGPRRERTPRARRAEDPPDVDYTHRRRIPLLLEQGTARNTMSRRPGLRDVVVEVEDNGPGIPEDQLANVFDPFFTTRAPGEGTGLGLAITARIVHELGGGVEAENREEGGARFSIRLPCVEEEDE